MYEHMNKSKLNKKGLRKKNFYFFLKRLHGRECFCPKRGNGVAPSPVLTADQAFRSFFCWIRMASVAGKRPPILIRFLSQPQLQLTSLRIVCVTDPKLRMGFSVECSLLN